MPADIPQDTFQSTLPCGSDTNHCSLAAGHFYFNPRSLAGATLMLAVVLVILLFQSTLPCGSDPITAYQLRQCKSFQSTLPHGSDVSVLPNLPPKAEYFNPRSLTGATYSRYNATYGEVISIHAPSRERPMAYFNHCDKDKFQSTLPHGSDISLKRLPEPLLRFQSTLPHGSDLIKYLLLTKMSISIHAPSRERR